MLAVVLLAQAHPKTRARRNLLGRSLECSTVSREAKIITSYRHDISKRSVSVRGLLHRRSSRLVIVLRDNGDISLDPDIVQGMHIITQELVVSPTPLDLRAVHALLHLQVLLIRRAGARLGQDVRVADIGVDVVRGRAAVLGAVLQLEGWE